MKQVLFVICMHNYGPFAGFRLNNDNYSAHHQENEVLLMEGAPMFVIDVEDIYMDHTKQHDELAQSMASEKDKDHLDKEKCYWGHFDGKTITVVYLFNATDYEDAVDDVI